MKVSYLKRYPLSHAITAIVIVLSLAPITEVPPQLQGINLLDKWAHMVMYGGLCLTIWWEYLHKHEQIQWRRAFIGAILCPILLGGSMELGQKYLTTCRNSEWLDAVANSTGVLLAAGLALLVHWLKKKSL